MNAARELELVELVSTAGAAIGTATVGDAHRAPGALHRAFSVVLFDPAGRTLLQRRSAGKTRFPLRWANACCGHPAPGEAVTVAALRRLNQELAVSLPELVEVGVYTYRAVDPSTGRVEYEYDHVLIGRVSASLPVAPDPAEVSEVRWIDPESVAGLAGAEYAPWVDGVLQVARGSSDISHPNDSP